MAGLWIKSNTQIHDANGKPLIGARAQFFLGGTSTPLTTYAAYSLGDVNKQPNPVTTDGNGFFPAVYFDEADGFYRERLTTAGGVILYDTDGIPIIGPSTGGGGGSDSPVDPNAVAATGDMFLRYGEGLRAGFVRCNGRTIGTSVSGASERANADAQALFQWLWTADPRLTVLGGRGANAAADWAANKQMTLPDWRSKAIIGMDTMGNIAASIIPVANYLGWSGGEPAHTLSGDEMPNHAHPLYDPGHFHNWGNKAGGLAVTPGNAGSFGQVAAGTGDLDTAASMTGITLGSVGGSAPHNNVQPSKALTIYIKL